MPIPLTIAAPAAAASLAYINARTQFSHDIGLVAGLVKNAVRMSILDRQDRVNLFYRLEENAQNKKLADHTFIIYEGQRWTYKQTYDMVLKYSTWLKAAHGVVPNEIVAMDYMNSPKLIFMLFAIWQLGACPALINYNLTSKPLVHCVKAAAARVVLIDEEIKERFTAEVVDELSNQSFLDKGRGAAELVVHDAALDDKISQISNLIREPDSSRTGAGNKTGNKTACLMFTSGTTGLPKPAIVSWYKCYVSIVVLVDHVGLRKDDTYYSCMPMYHSTATVLALIPCLLIGSTFACGHRFSNQTYWRDVRESKSTVIQYVGEVCRYLVSAPPQKDPKTGEDLDKKHNVRMAFGNGMRPDVWQRFKDRFGIQTIAEFYGATESPGASFNVSSNDFSRGAIGRAGSLLKLIGGSNSAIVEIDWETEAPKRYPDNNNFCALAVQGQPGEWIFQVDPTNIELKYQGYYGNESASNSKLLRDVFVKGDAYFRSGDAVRMDDQGLIWFCDRIGDTFRWRSENVSTNEVSAVLGGHPAVVEANVYGVEVPKHDGRCGMAAIELNKNVDNDLMQSLARTATSNLPKYAVPLFLRVTKKMQATGNFKQQKHGLRVEGIDPQKITADLLYWLKDGTYVQFQGKDYENLKAGQVKL